MTEVSKIVKETKVCQVRVAAGPQNRLYREIFIPYSDFSFLPGQFVMIRKDCGPSCWAYPYMIQSKWEEGFTVYAGKGTSLFDAEEGLPLVVWGPSGKAMPTGNVVVVLEPAAAFLAMPVFHQNPNVSYVMLASQEEAGMFQNYKNGTYVKTVEEAGRLLENKNVEAVIAALNVDTVQKLAQSMKTADLKKLLVFASTKISCGVDGCKSCYLHSKELPLGLSVCCNGPYLPYEKIDFETDVRCFHRFE